MRRKVVLGAAGAALLLFMAAPGLPAQDAPLAFDWAFVKRGAANAPVPLDFSEKVAVAKGDLFKIYVKPVRGAFVYLFLDDASDELSLLFPASFAAFAAPGYAGTAVMVPPGNDWFTLDGTSGTERFYLLASEARLTALETVTAAHAKVSADPKAAAAAKAGARQAVLDEIARLRRAHSALAVAAEKPVTFAGGTRGAISGIADKATRIEGREFYTRTFRLDH